MKYGQLEKGLPPLPFAKKQSRRTKKYFKLLKLSFVLLCGFAGFYFHYTPFANTVSVDDAKSIYLSILESSNLAAKWSKEFTKAPHLAGTNMGLVEWQAAKYKEFGLENVEIEDFDIYLNYPVNSSLKMLEEGEIKYHPFLKEDVLDVDPTTQGDDLVPSFHGYSANGNVTAQYIYANYGRKIDFEVLEMLGVEVKGKIVIVRYGGLFRGLKVKFAQEAGAVGVLIYSEPSDDGEVTIEHGYKPYPEGPARNPSSIQRGSVQFLSQMPGDPTTPGWASKGDNVDRVSPYDRIPTIPSLPISYREVIPILKSLNGHGPINKAWTGGLDGVSYNIGPNTNSTLEMYNEQDYKIRKIHNVYGEIKGHLKDEIILVGNHRDAWIKGGAGDPNSGSATTLEIIRVLNELKEKYGWKPLRTIRFASWDGEEYALLGSTEYGELYHKKLQQEVIAYLNLDDAVAGTHLDLEASPLLNGVINKAAKMVSYPKDPTMTLYDHFYSSKDKKIGMLGSGSDFTVFMEHLGITSLNAVFGPGPKDPIYHYHSNYDSFYWMSTYGDPGFVYHNTMAKFFGLIALSLADEQSLGFGILENSLELSRHFNETISKMPESWNSHEIISGYVGTMRDLNRGNASPDYKPFKVPNDANHDGSKLHGPKRHGFKHRGPHHGPDELLPKHDSKSKSFRPHRDPQLVELMDILKDNGLKLDIGKHNSFFGNVTTVEGAIKNVQSSIEQLMKASVYFEMEVKVAVSDYKYYDENFSWFNPIAIIHKRQASKKIAKFNRVMKYYERLFLFYGGLPGRDWFRHMIYAVDKDNGYAAVAMPDLLETITTDNPRRISRSLRILKKLIYRATATLEHVVDGCK